MRERERKGSFRKTTAKRGIFPSYPDTLPKPDTPPTLPAKDSDSQTAPERPGINSAFVEYAELP